LPVELRWKRSQICRIWSLRRAIFSVNGSSSCVLAHIGPVLAQFWHSFGTVLAHVATDWQCWNSFDSIQGDNVFRRKKAHFLAPVGIFMAHVGTVWHSLHSFGTCWPSFGTVLAHVGTDWQCWNSFGSIQGNNIFRRKKAHFLAPVGIFMAHVGTVWHCLHSFGTCWCSMAYFAQFRHMMAMLWHILAQFAHIGPV
jgi:hypothetical protein